MGDVPKPIPVSPTIRGIRWGLFIAGIIYARFKLKVYGAVEARFQEQERIRKIQHDKEMAIVKARIAKEEKEAVARIEKGIFD